MTLFILWLVAVLVILRLWAVVAREEEQFEATADPSMWDHDLSYFTARASRGKP